MIPAARSLRNPYAPRATSHGAPSASRSLQRVTAIIATAAWKDVYVQDVIWIGVLVGLVLLSLLYVSLADRA